MNLRRASSHVKVAGASARLRYASSVDLLAGLNPPQRDAVLHGDGPLLVLAGAGSGKTRVLTHRIAHLIGDRGVSPHEVIAITFTNKAAGEMRERLEQLVGPQVRAIWAATFHSACVRILRRESPAVGYERSFAIFDAADQQRLLRRCYEDESLDQKRVPPRAVLGRISDAKNRLQGPDELDVDSFGDEIVVRLYRRYQDRLRANQAMDFDDLLMLTVQLLEGDAEVRERYQQRFRHVLVDEYQDTNHAQYRLVRVLGEPQRNVVVVGDDDQGIYSWRGADVANILDFERDYPDATVVALEQNYRSTGTILRAANAVVSRNRHRHPKSLWTDAGDGDLISLVECRDEREEARVVIGEVNRTVDDGGSLSDIAVFYRTNAQSRAIEDMLVRSAIPYQIVGGPRFYERAEVKDLLAYLRVAANPSDEVSFTRMVATPKRGLGPGAVAKLAAFAGDNGLPLTDALADIERVEGLQHGQRQAFGVLAALIADVRNAARAGVGVDRIVEDVLERSGLRAALASESSIEAQGRLENLEELVRVGAEYEGRADEPSLEGFLEEIALYADADAVDTGSGKVTLMTIHNAKGLEFERVVIVGLEEGLFPHQRSETPDQLDEERRLFYVGITRARSRLTLTHARSRSFFGGRDWRIPSRFLAEVPAQCLEGGGVPAQPTRTDAADIVPGLSTGDEVVHATFGEGVVTGIEQGGELVLVRFVRDGSERRLIAGAAPMRKVAAG
jgi:DNA helicase-2/ATP-dependent DNA helicase PcrA